MAVQRTFTSSTSATKKNSRARRSKSDKPSATSVLYDAMSPWWEKVCDLLDGTDAMREAGTTYLPKEPNESDRAYQTRLQRSHLYNGLEGAVSKAVSYPFKQKVVITGVDSGDESAMAVYVGDVNGAGCSLTQFAADAFLAMVALGHVFLFVDWDAQQKVDEGAVPSKLEEESMGVRGRWKIIKATDMLNWRLDPKTQKPLEVSWREVRLERAPGKKWIDEEREYVRVYRADGTWELWRAKTALPPEETILGTYLGTRPVDCTTWWSGNFALIDSGRHTYSHGIPIAVAYACKTGEFTSVPPFKELITTNIEHWQSASDQRNILRFARLAQKVISGATAKDLDPKNQVHSVHNVMSLKDPNAKAYYLEHSGAAIGAGEKDLDRLESRMEGQGLQPLTTRTVDATATASMIDLKNISTDEQWWITQIEQLLTDGIEITHRWTNAEKPKEMVAQIYRDFDVPLSAGGDFDYVERMKDAGEIRTVTKLREAQRRNILAQTLDVEKEVEEAKMEQPEVSPEASAPGDYTLAAGDTGHEHEVTVDEAGNGTSTSAAGHVHQVKAGAVQPAGADGHVHEMEQTSQTPPEPGEEEMEEEMEEGTEEDEETKG